LQADHEGGGMPEDRSDPSTFSRLVSPPGVAALAILGLVIVGVSRLFGAGTVLQEVATEMIASFGNAVLLLAVFGLFFRSGLERLLRGAPGGEAYAGFAERVREVLQDLGGRQEDSGQHDQRGSVHDQDAEVTPYEAKLDRIEEGVKSLAGKDIPELRDEIREIRKLLLDVGHAREG
jgi:hypothetical protein